MAKWYGGPATARSGALGNAREPQRPHILATRLAQALTWGCDLMKAAKGASVCCVHAAVHSMANLLHTCSGAQSGNLLLQERHQASRVEECLCLLVQERLVCATTTLCHELERVSGARDSRDLNLSWKVGLGVCFREHIERCHLKGCGN
eukprot:scaffold41911_cov31-Tisochrysis_lutea.AAC.3